MLESTKPGAIIVATPHGEHFSASAAALERGINVLVEKPMVIDPAQAEALCNLAEATGAELLVGYTFHHTPHVIHLREEIASGAIGAVEHVSCLFASTARELYRGRPEVYREALGLGPVEPGQRTYADPAGGGGQAHTQLTHSAALALHLTGLHPVRVSAMTAKFELNVDLADAAAVEFAGGALGSLDSVGSVQPGHEEILECRVFGGAGHIEIDAIHGRAAIHRADEATEHLADLAEDQVYPVGAPARNLIGVTLGDAPNRAPGRLGLEVVRLLSAIFESDRLGRAVEVGEVTGRADARDR